MLNSPEQFLDHVISEFFVKMHERPDHNYDVARFSYDGVDRSNNFNIETHKQYLFYFLQNYKVVFDAYSILEDEASKTLYIDLILFRLLGHLHVKLKTNTGEHWSSRNRVRDLVGSPSRLDCEGMFGPLEHFCSIDFNGEKLKLDCYRITIPWTIYFRQYLFARDNVSIKPERNDHVIDAGACLGDTAIVFASLVGDGGIVYSFDPLDTHLSIIDHNKRQNNEIGKRVNVFPYALGDTCNTGAGPISSNNSVNPGFSLLSMDQTAELPTVTIDSLVRSGDVERVDFIKMDIEGYEMNALMGANESIRTFRPKLAISLYHKPSDMCEIPLYIHGLGLGYRIYIDHYTIHSEETVMYAVAD